jgi:hypothetical protein
MKSEFKKCPANAMDCPYYDVDTGCCDLVNPEEDCDEYDFFLDEEEEEEEENEDVNLANTLVEEMSITQIKKHINKCNAIMEERFSAIEKEKVVNLIIALKDYRKYMLVNPLIDLDETDPDSIVFHLTKNDIDNIIHSLEEYYAL